MQIIDEFEPHRRGPYGGAVGYIDFTGNMDTCIALRTLVLKGSAAYVQAGAGIVADSVPADEYQETVNKAKGLLKAIEIASGSFDRLVPNGLNAPNLAPATRESTTATANRRSEANVGGEASSASPRDRVVYFSL